MQLLVSSQTLTSTTVAGRVYFMTSYTGLTSLNESSTSSLSWSAGVWRTKLRSTWASIALRLPPSAADIYDQPTSISWLYRAVGGLHLAAGLSLLQARRSGTHYSQSFVVCPSVLVTLRRYYSRDISALSAIEKCCITLRYINFLFYSILLYSIATSCCCRCSNNQTMYNNSCDITVFYVKLFFKVSLWLDVVDELTGTDIYSNSHVQTQSLIQTHRSQSVTTDSISPTDSVSRYVTGWAVAQTCCISQCPISIGKVGNSATPGSKTTERITPKLGASNYVGDPTSAFKYGSDRPAWGSQCMRETSLFVTFFFSFSFTSLTRLQVAAFDRFSRSIHQNAHFRARKCLLGVSTMNFHIISLSTQNLKILFTACRLWRLRTAITRASLKIEARCLYQ